MIRHKPPGIDIQRSFCNQNSQPLEEITAIRIAKEYLFPFDSPAHDMMQNPGASNLANLGISFNCHGCVLTNVPYLFCRAWQMVLVGILRLSVSAYLVINLLDDAVAQRTSALYISWNYGDHLIL